MKTSILIGLLLSIGIYFLIGTLDVNISNYKDNLSKKAIFEKNVYHDNQNESSQFSASFIKLESGEVTPLYLSVFYYMVAPLIGIGLLIWFLMAMGFLQSLKKYTQQEY